MGQFRRFLWLKQVPLLVRIVIYFRDLHHILESKHQPRNDNTTKLLINVWPKLEVLQVSKNFLALAVGIFHSTPSKQREAKIVSTLASMSIHRVYSVLNTHAAYVFTFDCFPITAYISGVCPEASRLSTLRSRAKAFILLRSPANQKKITMHTFVRP